MVHKTLYLAIATPMNWDYVIDRYTYVTVHTNAIDIDVPWAPCVAME